MGKEKGVTTGLRVFQKKNPKPAKGYRLGGAPAGVGFAKSLGRAFGCF